MAKVISPKQLAYIHGLWRERMRRQNIAVPDDEARDMRHHFIRQVTSGRAAVTKELTFVDARHVISRLLNDLGDGRPWAPIADQAVARAAGTHGRRGHNHARQEVMAGAQQTSTLEAMMVELGWSRARLDAFIERQLGAGRQVRTMGQFNRVLWGLKAIARRQKR